MSDKELIKEILSKLDGAIAYPLVYSLCEEITNICKEHFKNEAIYTIAKEKDDHTSAGIQKAMDIIETM